MEILRMIAVSIAAAAAASICFAVFLFAITYPITLVTRLQMDSGGYEAIFVLSWTMFVVFFLIALNNSDE